MGRRGPKPLPAALRDDASTYQPPEVVVGEVVHAGDLPAPEHLADGAGDAWRSIVAALAGSGMLQAVDAIALEALAVAVATMRDAQEIIERDGIEVRGRFFEQLDDGTTVGMIAHPMLAIRDKAAGEVRAWGARFGMTPSDRVALGLQVMRGKAAAAASWEDDLGPNPRHTGGE